MHNDLMKLKRLMKAAHHLQKNKPAILRGASLDKSQALHYAWWFEDFRTKLRTGVWRFSFFKRDGSIREARGTLDLSIIPADKVPKSLSGASDVRPKNESAFPFFDLDKQEWRSFRLDNFIGFVSPVNQSTSKPED